MTHYAIKYDHPDCAVNDACAIRDAIEYLGRDNWQKSFGQLIKPGGKIADTPYSIKKRIVQQIRIGCMLAGIRGYPVRAIIRGVWAAHQ